MKLAKARQTGNKLKVYRVKRKLTAAELSEKAGVDRAAISHIENNRRRPRPETVLKLAFALGFEVDSAEQAAEILGIQMSKRQVPEVEAAQSQEPPEELQVDLTEDVSNQPAENPAEGTEQSQEPQEQQDLTEDGLVLVVEEELTISKK